VEAHVCNPSTWEEQEFKASLSHPGRPCLKKTRKRKKKGREENHLQAVSQLSNMLYSKATEKVGTGGSRL
jgi:hypothetical protein